MDLQKLRYFVAVAEYQNFTEAAKYLFISQPALSKQIAELEKEIGVQLFVRDKRHSRLTAAGTEFYEEALDILQRSEKVVQKVRQTAIGLSGTLKIGYLGTIPEQYLLNNIVKNFFCKYPNINITLSRQIWDPLNSALVDGEFDIGFTLSYDMEILPNIQWETVLSTKLSILVPNEHSLACKNSVDLQSINGETYIMVSKKESPYAFNFINRLFLKYRVSPKEIRQVPNIETLLMMIDAGLGVSIISSILMNSAGPNIRSIDINDDDAQFELIAAWRKGNLNPVIPLFLRELKSYLPITQF